MTSSTKKAELNDATTIEYPWQSRPDGRIEESLPVIMSQDLADPARGVRLFWDSMGSSSVAWFAAKYPDIPGAVILEDPRLIPRPSSSPRSSANAAIAAAQERRHAQILARNNTSYEALVAQCLKNTPQWGRSECEYWAPSKRLHHPDTAFRNRNGRPAMSELFAKITAPTLILKADAQGADRQKNEEVAGILKNGKIVHVEGARHNVRRDQKARLLKALRTFLGEL